MPRKASGDFDQNKYVQQYMKENVTVKKVVFNKRDEQELLEWATASPDGFSAYVKRLIREDMAKT